MNTQIAEPMTAETIRLLYRRISALSNSSMKKLYDYVETLIEEEEDAEDVAYIESLTPDDYADTVPIEEVIADYEKQKIASLQPKFCFRPIATNLLTKL